MNQQQAKNLAFLDEWAKDNPAPEARTKRHRRMIASNQIADRATAVAKLAGCSFGGLTEKRGVLFYLLTGYGTPEGGRCVQDSHQYFDYETVIDEPSRVINWVRTTNSRNAARAETLGLTA